MAEPVFEKNGRWLTILPAWLSLMGMITTAMLLWQSNLLGVGHAVELLNSEMESRTLANTASIQVVEADTRFNTRAAAKLERRVDQLEQNQTELRAYLRAICKATDAPCPSGR